MLLLVGTDRSNRVTHRQIGWSFIWVVVEKYSDWLVVRKLISLHVPFVHTFNFKTTPKRRAPFYNFTTIHGFLITDYILKFIF